MSRGAVPGSTSELRVFGCGQFALSDITLRAPFSLGRTGRTGRRIGTGRPKDVDLMAAAKCSIASDVFRTQCCEGWTETRRDRWREG